MENQNPLDLTPIEIKVINLMCSDNTPKEIAKVILKSHRTVEAYFDSIRLKFKVKHSYGVIVQAIKLGYVPLFPHQK